MIAENLGDGGNYYRPSEPKTGNLSPETAALMGPEAPTRELKAAQSYPKLPKAAQSLSFPAANSPTLVGHYQ